MNMGSVPVVASGDTRLNTPDAPGRPGAQAWTRDGRRFRLVKAGAAALATGSLCQGVGPNLGHLQMIPTADVPVGSRTIRVTAGSGAGTNVPENTYAGGVAIVNVTGAQFSYAVKGHEAIVATLPFTIVLESDDLTLILIAAATAKIDLIANPYLNVVATPGTAATGGVVGAIASPTGILAGNWGFVQVEGLAVLRSDAVAVTVGQAISPSVTVAGSATLNAGTLPVIGSAIEAAPTPQGFAVSLTLP